jgi:hypothetical protein
MDIKPNEWIRPGQIEIKPKREPLPDPQVSQIVGKRVNVNDPKLVKLVLKWRNQKDPNQPDNFLKDPKKIKELKETFK